MSGTTPEPPPTSSAGVSPSHTNHPPIGPRTSSSSPTSTTSCRNVETSPSSSRSTVSSISFGAVGRRRDRVRARRGVAVGRGQAHDVVLAGADGAPGSASASRNVFARAVSSRMSTHRRRAATRSAAVPGLGHRVSRPGSAARARGRRGRGSRSAPRTRARRGRAARRPGDPLGALPEVEVRHEQAGRAAVLARAAARRRPPTPPTPCRR